MIDRLSQLSLPNDTLIDSLRKKHKLYKDIEKVPKSMRPFERRLTLDVVKDAKFVEAAKEYIETLLKNKEEYGYLYYLMNMPLRVPLDVRFNGEMAIEVGRYDMVVQKLEDLARQWGQTDTLINEITRLELLYFFVLILNFDMIWVKVDFLLQGTNRKGLAHLIAAPERLLRNRREDKNALKEK